MGTDVEQQAVDEYIPITEDDFSVTSLAGDARAVLAQLRTRLLDLTLMNRLLQFKHGARTVRVIDELPDQLFTRLRNGDELEFIPVPRPAGERVTEASGKKKTDREAAARTAAQALGLNVDYELPFPAGGTPSERHTDKAIQTSLFPEDLERVLRAIASEARSAIEEKGSNVLHLIFGFLEWDDGSTKKVVSPLFMLPVTLRRGEPDRRTGADRFFISYSGEDLLPNISLQEKLRRDRQIVIPDIEEDETPDDYLRRVQETVPLLEGWAVRRQVSLGLLLFTKLLMFRDLDPEQWPKGADPAAHPGVLEHSTGVRREALST